MHGHNMVAKQTFIFKQMQKYNGELNQPANQPAGQAENKERRVNTKNNVFAIADENIFNEFAGESVFVLKDAKYCSEFWPF